MLSKMEATHFNLDLTNLVAVTNGDPGFIREILELIEQQSPPTRELMNNSYEVGDYKTLGAAAHKFKSSVAYLGNEKLVELTKRIELTATQTQDKQELFQLMAEFHAIYGELMSRIGQELDRLRKQD